MLLAIGEQTKMFSSHLLARVQGRYRRSAAAFFFRRPFAINSPTPFISFTFDDFPRSALLEGGAILKRFGLSGTYYASLGLMGKKALSGPIFVPEDLKALVEEGHELGCHTFDHCHSWETKTTVFENSIIENEAALRELIPGDSFRTFSYPISPPRPQIKKKTAEHFVCCRGGGQTFNVGTTDLNYLRAYFLEKDRDHPETVRNLIEQNRQALGWLILATHDIRADPSPFGCTPDFFEDIVKCAVSSGARILPVIQAWEVLRASDPRNLNINVQIV
jgi:peptidoglycan/xylan/chitin deacetylase (PgdA/CDA1 family)